MYWNELLIVSGPSRDEYFVGLNTDYENNKEHSKMMIIGFTKQVLLFL